MKMRLHCCAVICALFTGLCSSTKAAEYPSFDQVTSGYTKVATPSPTDGSTRAPTPMYTLYVKEKEGQLLIELPKNFASKKYFIGSTVASGREFAGLQADDFFVQWRQYNKRVALIAPNTAIRSGGDSESRDSVKRLFTGRVLLDLPILTVSPRGGPVIDGDAFLVGKSSVFFSDRDAEDFELFRPPAFRSKNPALAKIVKSKSFPQNVEIAFELPNSAGVLQTLYYSISEIPSSTGYKPRKADQRIGYFTTSYSDYGKYQDDEVEINYINRWHLEKRDSSLKVSPPKQAIKFYIEHTTPVRYRRWVKQGVLFWNKAFENIGISDAIQVEYQDKATLAHMDKDPEDVRYNFIRWLNNNEGTAIGPTRVHPETGQILDADIVLTDGWIRYFDTKFEDYMPLVAMQGMGEESRAWLAEHPRWDPRVRFAPPSQRSHIAAQLRANAIKPYAGVRQEDWKTRMLGDDIRDGLVGRTSQVNGFCMAATGRRVDTAIMRMVLTMGPGALFGDDKKKEDEEKEEPNSDKSEKDEKPETKEKESMLDGMPESFIGPLLADLVAHEVGHTLGLRHNFKASSVYSLAEINSNELKGQKPLAGSVMDYLPINLRLEEGEVQGDYAMIDLGPYDMWAIEYGYSFDKDYAKVLKRVGEPELQFATDEDTYGPDPLARLYDFGKEPLDFAKEQARLVERFRKRLMTDYVKDGDSWTKAREGYELTLNLQMKSVSMMANWIGGAHVNRDKKGDPKERPPIEVVSAEKQRDALKFVLETTFRDSAYALSPELLSRLTRDFFDDYGDLSWHVHDKILAIQSSTLTQLLSTTTLRRVYDNEFRIPVDQDAFTLPELLDSVTKEIWSELDGETDKKYSTRRPMISSLRRNLQREHMERLIDLTLPGNGTSAAFKAISNLCIMELKTLHERIAKVLEASNELDPYTKAHLYEAGQRIEKALDAEYVYNQSQSMGGGMPFLFFRGTDKEAGK